MEAAGLGRMPAHFLEQLETTVGLRFPDGYNPSLQFMAHLREPLKCHYRPLAVYAVCEWLWWLTHVAMRSYGYQRKRIGRIGCDAACYNANLGAVCAALRQSVALTDRHDQGEMLSPLGTTLARL